MKFQPCGSKAGNCDLYQGNDKKICAKNNVEKIIGGENRRMKIRCAINASDEQKRRAVPANIGNIYKKQGPRNQLQTQLRRPQLKAHHVTFFGANCFSKAASALVIRRGICGP